MTIDDLLKVAAERRLTLQHLQQYSYRSGAESRNDHWEATFSDPRGNLLHDSGRSAGEAIQKALYPMLTITAMAQQLSLEDLC